MSVTRAAIEKNRITFAFLAVILIAGVRAYVGMPQSEDPGFTIRTAMVITYFPGASPERVGAPHRHRRSPFGAVARRTGQRLGSTVGSRLALWRSYFKFGPPWLCARCPAPARCLHGSQAQERGPVQGVPPLNAGVPCFAPYLYQRVAPDGVIGSQYERAVIRVLRDYVCVISYPYSL